MRCPLLSFLRAPALGSDIPLTGPTAAVWIAPEEVVAASQGHAEDVTVLTTRAGTYAVLGELQEVVGEINDALQEGERERRRQLDSLLLGVEAYLEELNPGGPAVHILEAMREEARPVRRTRVFYDGPEEGPILSPMGGVHIVNAVKEAAVRSYVAGGEPVEFHHKPAGRFLVATVRVPDEGDATLPRTRMALAFLEDLREGREARLESLRDLGPDTGIVDVRHELGSRQALQYMEARAEELSREEADTGATVAPLFREELREEAVRPPDPDTVAAILAHPDAAGFDTPARRVARAVWEGATSLDLTDIHGPTVHLRCPTEDAALDLDRALHELAEAGNARAFDPTGGPTTPARWSEPVDPEKVPELVVRLLSRAYGLAAEMPGVERMVRAAPPLFTAAAGALGPTAASTPPFKAPEASLVGWLAWVRDCFLDAAGELQEAAGAAGGDA